MVFLKENSKDYFSICPEAACGPPGAVGGARRGADSVTTTFYQGGAYTWHRKL